ncbi:SDR family NAD(P)-dependent oxidoreductase [Streptomyces sp. NPDC055815]
MRAQRDGHIMTISSIAGLIGQEFCVAYAAAKFGVEGWMESLCFDVEPFGIRTTIVEPGFFRTELLVDASTTWAELSVEDCAERSTATKAAWQSMNGKQAGDPTKPARALLSVAEREKPPLRFVAGSDAIANAETKARDAWHQCRSRTLSGAK